MGDTPDGLTKAPSTAVTPSDRSKRGTFVKGNKAAARSRPRVAGIQGLLKRRYGEDGKVLFDRLDYQSQHAKSEQVQVQATRELLSRGWGPIPDQADAAVRVPLFQLPPGSEVSVHVTTGANALFNTSSTLTNPSDPPTPSHAPALPPIDTTPTKND